MILPLAAEKPFQLFTRLASMEKLVACPYCEKEAVVDLKPFQTQVKTVYRGDGESTSNAVDDYDFPGVIPTAAPANDKI